ncbi:hypothetical protein M422DRAFT_786205 [Sphaerobolus stellatus SS14]|uniref:Enoyl reductase (ER) domain-containing protein n=1 Tax=Sphaerobolus stellatus (strain SS14) TaxID=990650 RepID=A0A0C9T385_SPHS4|nr:hypothetical protein M422DRAFT_786205 [Sphaerobolus stellatus SS14]
MIPAIPSTMKGLQITEYKKPYQLSTDIPVPKIENDFEVLIKVAVAGYCSTEKIVQNGAFMGRFAENGGTGLPLVPSHEGVGAVVDVGSAVTDLKIGDRVGAVSYYNACGKCEDCTMGLEKYCEQLEFYGITRNGAAAEYFVADSRWTVLLPPTLSFDAAAPLMCAGATIYSGLKLADLRPGQTVAIIGAGALGHLGVQFAKCLGLRVVCVDSRQAPLDLVQSLKYAPDFSIDASQGVDYAIKTIGGYAHATLIATDSLAAHEYGLQITKKHGTLIVIGQAYEPIPIHNSHLIIRNINVKGSLLCDAETLKEMMSLIADKGIEVKTRSYPLEDIETLMEDYHKENHAGKLVLRVSEDE